MNKTVLTSIVTSVITALLTVLILNSMGESKVQHHCKETHCCKKERHSKIETNNGDKIDSSVVQYCCQKNSHHCEKNGQHCKGEQICKRQGHHCHKEEEACNKKSCEHSCNRETNKKCSSSCQKSCSVE